MVFLAPVCLFRFFDDHETDFHNVGVASFKLLQLMGRECVRVFSRMARARDVEVGIVRGMRRMLLQRLKLNRPSRVVWRHHEGIDGQSGKGQDELQKHDYGSVAKLTAYGSPCVYLFGDWCRRVIEERSEL
jgi:hypothetical protein